MRHAANDPKLNCNRMEKPPFTHPEITSLTTITKDKQLTNEHKVTCYEYHLQEVVIFHGRAAIVTAIMPQYIKKKRWTTSGRVWKPFFPSLLTSARGP